jgi:hypothetical protein
LLRLFVCQKDETLLLAPWIDHALSLVDKPCHIRIVDDNSSDPGVLATLRAAESVGIDVVRIAPPQPPAFRRKHILFTEWVHRCGMQSRAAEPPVRVTTKKRAGRASELSEGGRTAAQALGKEVEAAAGGGARRDAERGRTAEAIRSEGVPSEQEEEGPPSEAARPKRLGAKAAGEEEDGGEEDEGEGLRRFGAKASEGTLSETKAAEEEEEGGEEDEGEGTMRFGARASEGTSGARASEGTSGARASEGPPSGARASEGPPSEAAAPFGQGVCFFVPLDCDEFLAQRCAAPRPWEKLRLGRATLVLNTQLSADRKDVCRALADLAASGPGTWAIRRLRNFSHAEGLFADVREHKWCGVNRKIVICGAGRSALRHPLAVPDRGYHATTTGAQHGNTPTLCLVEFHNLPYGARQRKSLAMAPLVPLSSRTKYRTEGNTTRDDYEMAQELAAHHQPTARSERFAAIMHHVFSPGAAADSDAEVGAPSEAVRPKRFAAKELKSPR